MKIEFRNGLLYTTLKINHRGKEKLIQKVVIDTGALHTIISADAVADIGIFMEDGDEVVTSYGIGGRQYAFAKRINSISSDSFNVEGCRIDFGIIDLKGEIQGLLGLDLLMEAGVIIDFKNLLMYKSND